MGFEPMNATLRGWCVEPLHQRVIKNRLMSILYYSLSFVKNTSTKTTTIAIEEIIIIGKNVLKSVLPFIETPFFTAATMS